MANLKGLIAEIYRAGYDCKINVMCGKKSVTIIDPKIDEIFEANDDRPPVQIKRKTAFGQEYIYAEPIGGSGFYAFGGTYIACSDSRVRELNKYPIPLHDRDMTLEK
jgi:hypothetical protein